MIVQFVTRLSFLSIVCAAAAMGQPRLAKFEVPPQYSVGAATGGANTGQETPYPALTADLNHDGYGDIVTLDWGSGSVFVTLGGSQGFQNPVSYPAGSHPVSVAAGDFNSDGNLDLIVAGDAAFVLFGTGNGAFLPPSPVSVPPSFAYVAVGDFNGDGKLDIAFAGFQTTAEVNVVLGKGDGTFGAYTSTPLKNEPVALFPGSFHNNGRQDLFVVTSYIVRGQYIQLPGFLLTSNGDGTFQKGPAIFNHEGTTVVAVADMNGDGNEDLVVIGEFLSSTVQVFLGDGNGNFTAKAKGETETFPINVTVADVNGDGLPDVVTANADTSVTILLGNGDGTLQKGYSYNANAGAVWVGVGTYFGSDHADVAALNLVGNAIAGPAVTLLKNKGAGHYAELKNIEFPGAGQFALADMNGDGFLDLVVSNPGDTGHGQASVSILPGEGDGKFGKQIALVPVAQYATSPVVADFDGDGKPDFAVSQSYSLGPVTLSVGLQQANNTYSVVTTTVPVPVSIVWAGDLNGDGLPDLITASACLDTPTCGNVYVLLNAGHGMFGSPLQVGGNGTFVAVADFNNDGKPDLAISGGSTVGPAILLGNGNGTFGPPVQAGTVNTGGIMTAGDINGDGNQDLVLVQSCCGPPLLVLLGDGKGGFRNLPAQPFQFIPTQLFVQDFNGDGFPDLASIGANGPTIQIYLGNGTGELTLEPVTYYGASVSWGYAQPGDINNDGKPDFVFLPPGGPFSIFLNISK